MREYAFQGTQGFTVNDDDDLKQFVPTLFIGLGGTGKDILMRFRKRLYDEYGMPHEKFARFLVLDTDDQTDTPTGEKAEVYQPVVLRRDEGEFVKCTIEPTEFKGILAKARDEHDRRYIDWLHPQVEQLIPPGALEKGAGTFRQAGRLSFFRRYDKIRAQIIQHFRDMRAHAATHPTTVFGTRAGAVYDDRIEVVIITSLAGGTGSGMFIDVAYLVREILDNVPEFNKLESSHSTVIAVLPTIFADADPNLGPRFRQNAYAALLEMEYYNTPRPDENPFRPESDKTARTDAEMVEFYVNWDDPQSPERPIRTHAWDTCYLVDNVNDRRPGAAQKPAGVFQMVADYLFLDFGTSKFALAKRSARSNHIQLRDRIISARVYESPMEDDDRHLAPSTAAVLYENKYGCTFSSFGLAEIYIDKDRIDRSAAYRLASRLILNRWMGNPKEHTENTYEEWAKEDLQSGKPPAGETEAISFHPDNMWREMLKGDKHDWLALVDEQFDHLEKLDPDAGETALEGTLKTNDQALSKSTDAHGLAGTARRTLDSRLDEMRGSPAELGKMRKRLARLARQRFNRVGVLPTLHLLKVYRRAFEKAAERAGKQKAGTTPSNQALTARLRDAGDVPFVCRRIAQRIEYKRACGESREVVKKRYAIAAGENLEILANTLRDFVGSEEGAGVKTAASTLHRRYSRMREFLDDLQKQLDKRFDELQQIPVNDRNQSVAPAWDKARYDDEIDFVLRTNVGHGRDQNSVNWEKVEAEVLRAISMAEDGNPVSLAQLLDEWYDTYNARGDALADIADHCARACGRVMGDGVRLDQFANGNIVDYLMSRPKEERAVRLEMMADSSAPYYPIIRDYKVAVPPAFRNLLGRSGGKGDVDQKNVQKIDDEVNGISLKKGIDQRDALHRREQGPETSLIMVREMGGVPLHYYNFLKELEKEYHSNKNAQYRKTCHIKYRENFEDLPDIELIESDLIRLIRENVHYVLWCFLLRSIQSDNEGGFVVEVPDPAYGKRTYRLGARISRIVKHAAEREDVRVFLQRRWAKWREKATPTHLAVLYSAIKQTLEMFPKVRHAHSDVPDPPIFNCYKKLLSMTGDFLMETEEGRAWFEILREGDPLDDDYELWKERYTEVSLHIRETCLVEASPELPLYQINEKRIADVHLSGAGSGPRFKAGDLGGDTLVPSPRSNGDPQSRRE